MSSRKPTDAETSAQEVRVSQAVATADQADFFFLFQQHA